MTDSYISQLLTRRKAPPGQDRTDIYGRMEAFLDLKRGELTRLVDVERAEELKRRLGQAPKPLFQEFRALVLKKCVRGKRDEVRAIFEREPFGTLERLIARKLLDVVKAVAREELDSDDWLRLAARVGGRSKAEMRVIVLEFLDTDMSQISNENCVAFLEPLVDSWEIDMETLELEILLNRRLVEEPRRSFAYGEAPEPGQAREERGLSEFLRDRRLSGDATEEEIRLLRSQQFDGRRPTKLYYYRALQTLRDPVHFHDE